MTHSILSEVLMLAGLVMIVTGLWSFSRALGLVACGALLFFLGVLTVTQRRVTMRRPTAGG